jgi:hypothetical protein
MAGSYRSVHEFWRVHGTRLEGENGPDTFKHELVQKMGGLDGEIVGLIDRVSGGVGVDVVRWRMGEILSLQRMHLIQFEFCVDEFNGYLSALRLLDVMLCKT